MKVRPFGFAALLCAASLRFAGAAEANSALLGDVPPASMVQIEVQPSPTSEAELLRKAQTANEDLYVSLRSFVCNESVSRTRENTRRTKIRNLDTLTAQVSFESGQELYSDIRQNSITRPSLAAAGGAWSEGEFGTLLRQTQQLLRIQKVTLDHWGEVDGTPTAFVTFDVPSEESPWVLVVDGRSYKIPFRTEVGVETATGHIVSVKRDATDLPRNLYISEIHWSVDLKPTILSGNTWLLPFAGEYAVSYAAGNQTDRNHMRFGNYRRYGSETTLRFDAAAD